MLRSPNRNLNSLTNQRPNGKKQDLLELCTLVDKCSQIYRDDRIQLRSLIKDQQDPKLVELLQKYKKKVGVDDMSELQIELRKFINNLKGRKVATSPEGRSFVKRKNTNQKENFVSPPPIDINHSNTKMSTISQISEQSSVKKQSFVFLQRPQSARKEIQLEESLQRLDNTPAKSDIDLENTPAKSDADQLQFMTIISQSPHQMSSLIIDCKDTDEKRFSSRSFDQEVLLKYNVEEINAFRRQNESMTDRIIEQSSSACNHCGANNEIQNLKSDDIFPFALPELQSMNYKALVSQEIRSLFTDWTRLLQPSQYATYSLTQKTNLAPLSVEDQQQCATGHFAIKGISPQQLFDAIFPSCYHRQLNSYQMKSNIQRNLPGSRIDYDTLFRLCDNDSDGWTSVEEVGNILEQICDTNNNNPEFQKIENLLSTDILNFETLESFFKGRQIEGKLQEMDTNDFAQRLFQEVDLSDKGYLTKWDLYHNRDVYQINKLLSF